MTEPNFIAQEQGLNFNSVVEAIIKRSCIIDYGIIQKVVAKGVVEVAVAVAKTEEDMLCMTCVLANTASTALTIDIIPHVGDRVLVVYPRLYNDKMFNVTDSEDDNAKLTIDFGAQGYNLMSGIAILINQCKTSAHKNVITIDNGNVSAKLNKVEITTDSDGAITVDNGKATVNIDKNGNVTVDAQGKYKIKNSFTDLATVISKLADEIESLAIVCPNGAGSVDPTSVATIETWKQAQLQALLDSAPVTP